jgi:hypothetical protein
MKYKVQNSKMPLQQNEQRYKQRLAKYRPSSGINSNIQYFTTIRAHRLCMPKEKLMLSFYRLSQKSIPFQIQINRNLLW